jgi:hypothetical protein
MRLRYLIVSALLVAGQGCFGQDVEGAKATGDVHFSLRQKRPIIVIEASSQSLLLSDLASANYLSAMNRHTTGIQSITVLDDNVAQEKYGARAKDGVVVVRYKDKDTLPPDIQRAFSEQKN